MRLKNLITMNRLEWILLPYSNVIIPIVIMDGLQSTRKEDALMKSSIEMNFVLVIIFRGFYIMRKADGVIIWRN